MMLNKIYIFVISILISCSMLSFEEKITTDDILNSFVQSGLECDNVQSISKETSSPLPKVFIEASECFIPELEQDIRVFRFDSRRDLETVRDFYVGFEKLVPSYLYVCGDFLFQTKKEMPVDMVNKYRMVFLEVCHNG